MEDGLEGDPAAPLEPGLEEVEGGGAELLEPTGRRRASCGGTKVVDGKSTLNAFVDVFNVLNQQKPVQTDPTGESGYNNGPNLTDASGNPAPVPPVVYINNRYGQALYWEEPRTVRLSVSYDY